MGHLSANPAGPDPSGEPRLERETGSSGHRWLWIIGLVLVIAVGVWYFRGSRASIEAQDRALPPGEAKDKAVKVEAAPRL